MQYPSYIPLVMFTLAIKHSNHRRTSILVFIRYLQTQLLNFVRLHRRLNDDYNPTFVIYNLSNALQTKKYIIEANLLTIIVQYNSYFTFTIYTLS